MDKKRQLLYSINQLLTQLKDEIRDTEPIGWELHQKTLQIIRLENYRNAAYDENGNWR